MRHPSRLAFLTLTLVAAVPAAPPVESAPPPIPEPGPLAQALSLDQVGLPLAQTRAAIPADNPQAPDKIALGERLFFDGRLSVDGTVACASCHDPARAFTDGRPTSVRREGTQRSAERTDGAERALSEDAVLGRSSGHARAAGGAPEIDDLVAFMASLTSKAYEVQVAQELARQRELSRTTRPQRDTARAFGPKPPRPKPPAP